MEAQDPLKKLDEGLQLVHILMISMKKSRRVKRQGSFSVHIKETGGFDHTRLPMFLLLATKHDSN